MSFTVTYVKGAELPDLAVNFEDFNGNTINLSSGWTFTVKVGADSTTSFTKTTNITGAATSPNCVVSWTAADLGALTAGRYIVQIHARQTSDNRDRIRKGTLIVEDALT